MVGFCMAFYLIGVISILYGLSLLLSGFWLVLVTVLATLFFGVAGLYLLFIFGAR